MGRTAVVVGGGIGGLAAAIGLRRIGWEVTVVERASVLDDAGAGISLAANGLRALDELGVGEAVREASRGQYTGGTRTPGGSWLARMDGAELERAVGTPIMGIPRATLHRLLRAALPTGTLLTGAEAGPVSQIDLGTVRVVRGGTALDADLVVAADSVGSAIRGRLFPAHPGPVHSGSAVLRAITAGPLALRTDFELTWGHGAEFGHIAFPDGRAEWHAVLGLPEERGSPTRWPNCAGGSTTGTTRSLHCSTRPGPRPYCTTTSANSARRSRRTRSAGSRSSVTRRTR